MRVTRWSLLSMLSLCLSSAVTTALAAQPVPEDIKPNPCEACAEWNQPHAPFKLYGNSYYVGVEGLSSILISTRDGLVLLDGGLPQSAPLIADNIRALGFKLQDIRYIGMSHAHFDHAGGIAALVRLSGGKATVLATARGAEALRTGIIPADDPQAALKEGFPPVKGKIRVLADGERLSVGGTTLQIHATPGHTPGGSSWSWQSCEGKRCLNLVYADSLTPVSADDFHFGPANSQRVAQFRQTIAKVGALRCDVLVSAHPGFSNLFERAAQQQRDPDSRALENPDACLAYAKQATERLDKRLQEEAAH